MRLGLRRGSKLDRGSSVLRTLTQTSFGGCNLFFVDGGTKQPEGLSLSGQTPLGNGTTSTRVTLPELQWSRLRRPTTVL